MFPSEYIHYGVFKVQDQEVWIYKDRWNYIRVSCHTKVRDAYWTGPYLIVTLVSGQVRRYMDHIRYEIVG